MEPTKLFNALNIALNLGLVGPLILSGFLSYSKDIVNRLSSCNLQFSANYYSHLVEYIILQIIFNGISEPIISFHWQKLLSDKRTSRDICRPTLRQELRFVAKKP